MQSAPPPVRAGSRSFRPVRPVSTIMVVVPARGVPTPSRLQPFPPALASL